MIYSDFQGDKISQLGFGAMRLPLLDNGSIDEAQVAQMVDLALKSGLNYFDTAYPYHGGESERVLGRILSAYPRESFRLASKFPGHQLAESYDPKAIFEEQLQKCQVDYFDFYLLHNVCELSLKVYDDDRWGIIDYLVEQKLNGRIRHLGFSSHGGVDNLAVFLDEYAPVMEFCQIQLNYMDWTLQNAREKCAILAQYQIPVWVMEPLRGGKLANLPALQLAHLQELKPQYGAVEWAFRWLQGLNPVQVVLSGMSSLGQMEENLRIFEESRPLSANENDLLLRIAEEMKDSVPCTGCRYCMDACLRRVDIPGLIQAYNDVRFGGGGFTVSMMIDATPEDRKPSSCLGCGACTALCPQGIDIPAVLHDLAARVAEQPSWADVCREREEINRRNSAKR